MLPGFEQGSPTYIKYVFYTKLNVVNKVLATKEATEYDQRIHIKIPDLFQHQAQV